MSSPDQPLVVEGWLAMSSPDQPHGRTTPPPPRQHPPYRVVLSDITTIFNGGTGKTPTHRREKETITQRTYCPVLFTTTANYRPVHIHIIPSPRRQEIGSAPGPDRIRPSSRAATRRHAVNCFQRYADHSICRGVGLPYSHGIPQTWRGLTWGVNP